MQLQPQWLILLPTSLRKRLTSLISRYANHALRILYIKFSYDFLHKWAELFHNFTRNQIAPHSNLQSSKLKEIGQ